MARYNPYTYSSKSGTWVKIENVEDLVIAFNRLNSDKAVSYVVAASRASAEVILAKARANLVANGSTPAGNPDNTGDLLRSLQIKQAKVRTAKWSRQFLDTPIFTVGPKYGKSANAANYGHAVELGHHLMRGKKHVGESGAKPYLRPAADGSKEEVMALVTNAMNKALEEFGDKT